jgi:putative PIN family toxin of toxin-antitoxin system
VRLVADTNIVISGLLWHGAPRRLLDAARAGKVSLFTTAALLVELEDTLSRAKFAERLERAGVTRRVLVQGYAALATVVKPAAIPPAILADPDDDAVLACAVAAQAQAVASGDSHLLNLKTYQDIPILTVNELLALLPD